MDIADLKKALKKNSKSLLFARLSDALRLATSEEQKNEALALVNKGLGVTSGFLPGKLVRGRILLENGDFAGAKADFEAVAEQDPFCLSAQKLLLETLVVLGQQPKTGIYAKILNTLEPNVKVETNAQEIRKVVSSTSAALGLAQSGNANETEADIASISDALDSILEEENNNNENEILNLLLQTFDNIFGKILSKEPPPDSTGKQDSLLTNKDTPHVVPVPVVSAPVVEKVAAEKAAPSIEALAAEQLAPKTENLPDLTNELDSLLADEGARPKVPLLLRKKLSRRKRLLPA